jgi:hypothetical protein
MNRSWTPTGKGAPQRVGVLRFLATAMPGGYRALTVLLITALYAPPAAELFSQLYFWSGVIAAVTGIPLASVSYARQTLFTFRQMLAIVSLGSFIAAGSASFWIIGETPVELGMFLLAIILMNLFEVSRTEATNDGHYATVALSLTVASVMFLAAIVLVPQSGGSAILILFASTAMPMLACSLSARRLQTAPVIMTGRLVRLYATYVVSSGLSTGVMSIVPLLLIAELSVGAAAELAQVFALGSAMFLVPRFLAAQIVPQLRCGLVVDTQVERTALIIMIFALANTAVVALASGMFAPYYLKYIIFYAAMQVSQTALPFSNIQMVNGNPYAWMRLNLGSTLLIAVLFVGIYLVMDHGLLRSQLLSVAFAIAVVRRVLLSRNQFRIIRTNCP